MTQLPSSRLSSSLTGDPSPFSLFGFSWSFFFSVAALKAAESCFCFSFNNLYCFWISFVFLCWLCCLAVDASHSADFKSNSCFIWITLASKLFTFFPRSPGLLPSAKKSKSTGRFSSSPSSLLPFAGGVVAGLSLEGVAVALAAFFSSETSFCSVAFSCSKSAASSLSIVISLSSSSNFHSKAAIFFDADADAEAEEPPPSPPPPCFLSLSISSLAAITIAVFVARVTSTTLAALD
mmetsp:Transcript_3457/g.9708  ORF Transcript_3457/g.9708 Transcript_3457/m.9708 type:complete len:236 (+) Transcript_3457:3854-4561(+)